MIVRNLDDLAGTDRDIRSANGNWRSRRIVLADDGAGFSLHETTIAAGTVNEFHYTNHVEAVWVLAGTGTLTDRETGVAYPLGPGTMYLLDRHDRHTLTADTELRTVCVFTPALTGRETHDESGSYPLAAGGVAS